MAATIFPVSLYEDLLPKIVSVLELTQQTEFMTNQEAKQRLLQAVRSKFETDVLITLLMSSIDKRVQERHLPSKRCCDQSSWRRVDH